MSAFQLLLPQTTGISNWNFWSLGDNESLLYLWFRCIYYDECIALYFRMYKTLLLPNMTCPVLANSGDPDQLASEEANWSGSALFVIKYVNFYQKSGSCNLIGWTLEVGMASYFIQHDKG